MFLSHGESLLLFLPMRKHNEPWITSQIKSFLLFLGVLLGLFFLIAPFTTAIVFGMYGLISGLIIGTIVGLMGYAFMDTARSSQPVQAGEMQQVLQELESLPVS